jgi:hypothetical protein
MSSLHPPHPTCSLCGIETSEQSVPVLSSVSHCHLTVHPFNCLLGSANYLLGFYYGDVQIYQNLWVHSRQEVRNRVITHTDQLTYRDLPPKCRSSINCRPLTSTRLLSSFPGTGLCRALFWCVLFFAHLMLHPSLPPMSSIFCWLTISADGGIRVWPKRDLLQMLISVRNPTISDLLTRAAIN